MTRNTNRDSRALRVLLAGDTTSPHSARVAAALAERGHVVLVLNGPALVERTRRDHGQPVTDVRCVESRLAASRWSLLRRMSGRADRYRLRRLPAWNRVDVIHVHNLYCGERLDRLAYAGRLSAPMVVTVWGTDVDDSAVAKHPSYPPMRRAMLERAAIITGNSEAMLRRCRAIVPHRPAEDFRLVRWYPDGRLFNADAAREGRARWRARLGVGADAFVFLSHRNTAANYRIDRIVRAFAAAFPDGGGGRRTVLVVKGFSPLTREGIGYVEELRRLAAPLGDRVTFVGDVPLADVPGLFAAADAAIGIPQADGQPTSMQELMALGVPMIVADLEDYAGLVTHEVDALIVDASRDEPVAAAMQRMASDEGLRERLRRGGLAATARHGGLTATVDAFVACYREAMARFAGRERNWNAGTKGDGCVRFA